MSLDLVDDTREFFAPASSDLIDGLLGQYQQARKQIDQLAGLMTGDLGNVVHYFIKGNVSEDQYHRALYVTRLFQAEMAIKALDAAYWSKALAFTDVLDYMPQARRDQWNKQLSAWKDSNYKLGQKPEEDLAEFTEEAVRPTISALLSMRAQFFGERVDGIFRALSHEHVTNCPEGFSKRMILNYVYTSYGTINHTQAGCINDLRSVIAKFMGRDELKWNATDAVIQTARNRHGEWLTVDGGAMRIRVYLKGTAHLEVHPDMAWRLNLVLAGLYPAAIPAKFRQKPKRKTKDFQMMGRPLPFTVVSLLAGIRTVSERIGNGSPERYREIKNARQFGYGEHDKVARAEAERVLECIGGVRAVLGKGLHYFQFDYEPGKVIEDIVASGCIPDQKSHQFYPTPESIAQVAAEMADIGDDDTVLEPSAGHGDLAAFLPQARTHCVEISALHCDILKARGFNVDRADFIEWAKTAPKFDRVVMNPPFSEGRALHHLQTAAELVKPEGRIVAILPSSMRGKDVLPGWTIDWSQVFSGEFSGTSVSVVILSGKRCL